MIPCVGRTVAYYNGDTALEAKIVDYSERDGFEEFLFEVVKIHKESLVKEYKIGQKIPDKRKIGEETLESGFCMMLDEI